MRRSKHALTWLLSALAAVAQAGASAHVVRSATELNALKAQAHRSKRLVLLSITSSDPSCWQCKKISKEFFADRDFMTWVDRHAVLGEIDIATKTKAARQDMLGAVYAAHAAPVPALILLHPDGRQLDNAPRNYWTTSQVVTNYQAIYLREIEGAREANGATETAANNAPAPAEAAWSPPAAKPVHYPGLKLKSITGTGPRRFALINDQTLAPGETAKVLSDGVRLSVTLVEIRDGSARVRVQGDQEPRTLTLKSN